jgi:Holliday junction DNA helicase RuvB
MDFYEPGELVQVLTRSASLLGVRLERTAPTRSPAGPGARRGSPTGCCGRVRDYAEVRSDGVIDRPTAQAALTVYDVDEIGLDRLDRAVLDALVRRFGGGPVGVATLAVAVGEEQRTVEEVAEPYLVRAGMLARHAARPGGHAGGLGPPGSHSTRTDIPGTVRVKKEPASRPTRCECSRRRCV